jgi:hypothetical protein
MSSEDQCCEPSQSHPMEEQGRAATQPLQVPMNAKLTDTDRRAVDFLLGGEEPSLDIASPMARNAFMDRVQAVRRLLGLLDAIPAEGPSTDLLEATLSQVPLHQQQAGASNSAGSQPVA